MTIIPLWCLDVHESASLGHTPAYPARRRWLPDSSNAYTAWSVLRKVFAGLRNALRRTVSGASHGDQRVSLARDSDVDHEPLVGRCTLYVPILGMNPGTCLLLESV